MEVFSMIEQVVIIGAGGFGREVQDIFEACNDVTPQYDILGYLVDKQYGMPGTIINDLPVLGDIDWLEKHKDVHVICAVGAPHLRQQLIQRVDAVGVSYCNIKHPNAAMTKRVLLGHGVVITAGCIMTNNIKIGSHVHINLDCTVGHDVVLEDFVTLSPGVHVSGNVTIKEGCYIGTGANIIEKVEIGEWSIVGSTRLPRKIACWTPKHRES
jgi:sugar O-acyltransferase (sialic acid O-acetyltransferase NeuD family)